MHTKNLFIPAMLALILLTAPSAVWGFTLRFKGNPTKPINETYNLQSTVQVTQTATVRHRGDATDYFVTFDGGQNGEADLTGRYAAHETSASPLNYQILDAQGAEFSNTEGFSGSFPASSQWQEITFEYTIRFLPGQFPESGRFEDEVNLQIYSANSTTGSPAEESAMSIRVQMDEVIDMQIVSSGAGYGGGSPEYELSYGRLLPETTREADLSVLANTSYNVILQSREGGSLREVSSGDAVPYLLRFSGSTVDLSTGGSVTAAAGQSPTSPNGRDYPIQIEILPYDALPAAGQYEDVITVEIQGL